MEILCPILLVIVGAIISQVSFSRESPEFSSHDVSTIGKQIILYSQYDTNTKISEDYFIKNGTNVTSIPFDYYGDDISGDENISETKALELFIDSFYNETIHTESSGDNEVDMNSDDYVGYFGSFFLLNEKNSSFPFPYLNNNFTKKFKNQRFNSPI